MSGSEQGAGTEPPSAAPASDVQPAQSGGSNGYDLSLSHEEVLAGVGAARKAETSRLQENLQRRAADRELLDELARHDFTGPHYQRFENELARYGVSVLRGWMYTGYVFELAAGRGLTLHPTEAELEELHRDSDIREELATMTVAVALKRFRDNALIGGGWRYDGGASLATYFMGACLYVFPNEFRKHRAYHRRWTAAQIREARMIDVDGHHIIDPEQIVMGRLRVSEELKRVDPRAGTIIALTIDGYSQEEIAEMLRDSSVRAIEGVLYRWRVQRKKQMNGGADRD